MEVQTQPAPVASAPAPRPRTMSEECLRLKLTPHIWGVSASVPIPEAQQRDVMTQKADPTLVSLRRKLIKSKAYSAILSADGAVRRELRRLSLPEPGRSGSYVIPLALVPKADEIVEAYLQQRNELVALFLPDKYLQAIEEVRQKDPLFKESAFPSADRVRKEFWVDYSFENMGVPDVLEKLSKATFDRQKVRLAERITEAKDEAVGALRRMFADLMKTLAEKFEAEPGGKKKFLRKTTVKQVLDFVDNFEALNIANDQELAGVVAQFREVVQGGDLRETKNDPDLAKEAGAQIKKIRERVDCLVKEAPVRRIDVD